MRRATAAESTSGGMLRISIHALHEESDQECLRDFQSVVISIHALHEESDSRMTSRLKPQDGFQSTLSMRRATELRRNAFRRGEISIHALHEESDSHGHVIRRYPDISIHALHEESDSEAVRYELAKLISIHALHEESDMMACPLIAPTPFQSTLSMRRATRIRNLYDPPTIFQSTLSMRRATTQPRVRNSTSRDFNPRSP